MNYKLIKREHFKLIPLKHLNQWLAALRSGVYTQTHNWLKRTDQDGITGHCCLGVLCEVEGVESFEPEDKDEGYAYCWKFGKYGSNAVLDTSFIEQAFTLGESGTLANAYVNVWDDPEDMENDLTPDNSYKSLAEMNDAGFSFAEIADILEACFTHID